MTTMKEITPANAHETLSKYMLADGFELIYDYKKARGLTYTTAVLVKTTSTSFRFSPRCQWDTTTHACSMLNSRLRWASWR